MRDVVIIFAVLWAITIGVSAITVFEEKSFTATNFTTHSSISTFVGGTAIALTVSLLFYLLISFHVLSPSSPRKQCEETSPQQFIQDYQDT